MSQRQWIIIIGVWVMVFLFLGFPHSWEKAFAILTGFVIIIFAYRIKFKEAVARGNSSFTDSLSSNTKQGGQDNQAEAPNSKLQVPNNNTFPSSFSTFDSGPPIAVEGMLSTYSTTDVA